ncbi:unnamed protein product [Cyprideis torosa]|uniref:Uncharacterized protein n=1 Tax=Cyprideis torosa TaxID=163714 RepID=A0A7R8WW28_9CRUS|nr:unnamed protein product [Cyprideis torosa]CAG0907974.1 unnamed protein product [Cyprideis torosa]
MSPSPLNNTFSLHTIGLVHSPFKEKFGIPRQSGLVPSVHGHIALIPPYSAADTVRGLEQFSHLWVTFVFHQHVNRDWSALVRPPRLGGNEKVGVYASRSTFRPNMLGQSVVKLESVEIHKGQAKIKISGFDLMDQTPVLDIKPYIPYNDAIEGATGGFAATAPRPMLDVVFKELAEAKCRRLENESRPKLHALIREVLIQDPRPAYRKQEPAGRIYGVRLFDLDVRFSIDQDIATVLDIHHQDAD